MAKRERKSVHHVEMTDGKRAIIQGLLQEYDIQNTQDIQDALKDLLGGTIKEMMEAEMDDHLGYEKSERTMTVRAVITGTATKANESIPAMEVWISMCRRTEILPSSRKS